MRLLVVLLCLGLCWAWDPAFPSSQLLWANRGIAYNKTTQRVPRAEAFGTALTASDVNCDGFPDIIVGAWKGNDVEGRPGCFYVYEGPTLNNSAVPISTICGRMNVSYFGWSVLNMGDLNNDGCEEVAVGTPILEGFYGRELNYYTNAGTGYMGEIVIYQGSPNGLIHTPLWSWTTPEFATGESYSLAKGDVNGDGHVDLVAGGIFENLQVGSVKVFLGTGNPSLPFSLVDLSYVSIYGHDGFYLTASHFGASVDVCDVNGDGYDDVVVGAPNGVYLSQGALSNAANTVGHTGYVNVYYGNSTGFSGNNFNLPVGYQLGGSETYGVLFGWTVSCGGDLNGDGIKDIVVGAPGEQRNFPGEGAVFLFEGRTGYSDQPLNLLGVQYGGAMLATLGMGLAHVGDLDKDGYDDVGASAPGFFNPLDDVLQNGRVYFFYGAPNGFSANIETMDCPANLICSGFGQTVAHVPKPFKTIYDGVLVGSSYKDGRDLPFDPTTTYLLHWLAREVSDFSVQAFPYSYVANTYPVPTFNYTLVVYSEGPGIDPLLRVNLAPDDGFKILSVTPTFGYWNASQLSWHIANLTALVNVSAVVTYTVDLGALGDTAQSCSCLATIEASINNRQATPYTTHTVDVVRSRDVAVWADVEPTFEGGGFVTVNYTVTNWGPFVVPNAAATLMATSSSAVAALSSDGTSSFCAGTPTGVACALPTMEPNTTLVVTIVYQSNPGTQANIPSYMAANVTTLYDYNQTNNAAGDTTTTIIQTACATLTTRNPTVSGINFTTEVYIGMYNYGPSTSYQNGLRMQLPYPAVSGITLGTISFANDNPAPSSPCAVTLLGAQWTISCDFGAFYFSPDPVSTRATLRFFAVMNTTDAVTFEGQLLCFRQPTVFNVSMIGVPSTGGIMVTAASEPSKNSQWALLGVCVGLAVLAIILCWFFGLCRRKKPPKVQETLNQMRQENPSTEENALNVEPVDYINVDDGEGTAPPAFVNAEPPPSVPLAASRLPPALPPPPGLLPYVAPGTLVSINGDPLSIPSGYAPPPPAGLPPPPPLADDGIPPMLA